jgi:dihydrofolate synthase/folylpolyglutamate synthase
MEYKEVLDYLLKLETFGMKLGLDNINRILSLLGNPHKSYPSIHIAGTNGKGSTAAILESILAASGYRIGLYTSPHLVDFRERIRINGRQIDPKYVADFFTDIKDKLDTINPTYFEVTTALAFKYFQDEKVDLAVIETGLGGRFDSTNVLMPIASVITNIDLEHTKHLGNSISQIALEKAGIIKSGVPVITAAKNLEAKRVIRQTCKQRKSNLISVYDETQWVIQDISERNTEMDIFTRSQKYYNLRLSLPGRHQLENAICAILAAEQAEPLGIRLTPTGATLGFRDVKWPGRLQKASKSPEIILDVGHNPAAMKILFEYFKEFYRDRYIIAVFGILSDKDAHKMMVELDRFTDVIILTKPMTDRAADPEMLARQASHLTDNFQIIPHVRDAVTTAINAARPTDLVLITGSHYTVGEALSQLTMQTN